MILDGLKGIMKNELAIIIIVFKSLWKFFHVYKFFDESNEENKDEK